MPSSETPTKEPAKPFGEVTPELALEFNAAKAAGAVELPPTSDETSSPAMVNLKDAELNQIFSAALDVKEEADRKGIDMNKPENLPWVRGMYRDALSRYSPASPSANPKN